MRDLIMLCCTVEDRNYSLTSAVQGYPPFQDLREEFEDKEERDE